MGNCAGADEAVEGGESGTEPQHRESRDGGASDAEPAAEAAAATAPQSSAVEAEQRAEGA